MILVTGATGNNGAEIIGQLIPTGAKIRALVRNPQKEATKVEEFKRQGIEVATGDLAKPETLDAALETVETAFMLSPVSPQQVELQSNFIEAARRNNVRRIVKLSMFGADPNSPVPLAKWHGQTEQELATSGLEYTNIRPNDLMGYNTKLMMPTVEAEGIIYDQLGDARISMIDERDVPAVAVKTLIEDGHAGQTYILTGAEALSMNDIAQKLAAALGKPVRYVNISPEEVKKSMIAAGLPEQAGDLVNALRAAERLNSNTEITETVKKLLGRNPIAYESFARDFAGSRNNPAAS